MRRIESLNLFEKESYEKGIWNPKYEKYIEYLRAWEAICKGGSLGGPIGELELSDRFRWLSACKSTVLQCSKTHPGLCTDPEKELEDLFKRYVL